MKRTGSGSELPPGAATVSELTRRIRSCLEESFGSLWVVGEISGLARPRSGHVYMTLKDDKAQLRGVMWRSTAARVRFDLEDGQEVVAFGQITVYEPRGQYQLIIRRIQPRGVGALQLAFQQMTEKLDKEGLFDPDHKKPLPFIPDRIGIVTSPTGACIRDILKQLNERFPNFDALVAPVRVQGDAAAGEIANAIHMLNRREDIDVIIVGRGGGSIEDLWPFNEEVVARAIFNSRIPVISAVGHEVDVTISDLVADARALTPTAAGEMVVPDKETLVDRLRSLADRQHNAALAKVGLARTQLEALARVVSPSRLLDLIHRHQQHLDDLLLRLQSQLRHSVKFERELLGTLAGRLEALSPLGVLARGYSVSLKDSRPLRKAEDAQPGDKLKTILARGTIESTVDAVRPDESLPPDSA